MRVLCRLGLLFWLCLCVAATAQTQGERLEQIMRREWDALMGEPGTRHLSRSVDE